MEPGGLATVLKNKTVWIVVFVIALGTVAVLYWQGLIWAGAASHEISWQSGGGRSKRGWSIGSRSVYLRKDQVFSAPYEVEIRRGSLRLYLLNRNAPFGAAFAGYQVIQTSGKGEFSVKIHETGWYKFDIDGRTEGNGYDLEYSVRWGAKSPP